MSEAAVSFDAAHADIHARARRHLLTLDADGTSLADQQRLRKALFEMRSSRYAVQPLRLTKGDQPTISPRYAALQQYALQSTPHDGKQDGGQRARVGGGGDGEEDGEEDGGKDGGKDGDGCAPYQSYGQHRRPRKAPGGLWRAIEKAEPEARHVITEERPVVVKKAWKIEASIWAGRRAWTDSRAFYDSLGFLAACFSADWTMAQVGGGLERAMIRFHTTGGDAQTVMEAVKRAMLARVEEIYTVFDNYAMAGGGDFTHIQQNSYRDFLNDCELVEAGAEGLCASRWDECFVAINAAGAAAKDDQFNHKKGVRAGVGVIEPLHLLSCVR